MSNMNIDKLKRLALRIYAAGESDRQWILGNLSSEEAKQLTALLDEIKSKKLPADPDVIQDSLNELKIESVGIIERNDDKFAEYVRIVNRLDSKEVVKMLMPEDPWILAVILDIHAWVWQDELEKALDSNKILQIKHYRKVNSAKVKNEVRLTLLKALSELNKVLEVNNKINKEDDTITHRRGSHMRSHGVITKAKSWWVNLWQ